MADRPTIEQLGLLRKIAAADGYLDKVDDAALADGCVDLNWLTPEGAEGYGLTLDGYALLRDADTP